jgi:hypothetical protein
VEFLQKGSVEKTVVIAADDSLVLMWKTVQLGKLCLDLGEAALLVKSPGWRGKSPSGMIGIVLCMSEMQTTKIGRAFCSGGGTSRSERREYR